MLQTIFKIKEKYYDRIKTGKSKQNSCLFYRKFNSSKKTACKKHYGPTLINCCDCNSYINYKKKISLGSKKTQFMFRSGKSHFRQCSVCGAHFETRSFVRDRCVGTCRHNLHDYFDFEGIVIENVC